MTNEPMAPPAEGLLSDLHPLVRAQIRCQTGEEPDTPDEPDPPKAKAPAANEGQERRRSNWTLSAETESILAAAGCATEISVAFRACWPFILQALGAAALAFWPLLVALRVLH